jgi:hypothetical protein
MRIARRDGLKWIGQTRLVLLTAVAIFFNGALVEPIFAQTTEDAIAAERIKLTLAIVDNCVKQIGLPQIEQERLLQIESEIRQKITVCVNSRLAREGKPWRWNPGAMDINIKEQR